MGGGSWDNMSYSATRSATKAAGKSDFGYTDDVMARTPVADRKTHDDLNPFEATRESRDNAEHPTTLPITVFLDVTGSMASVPRMTLEKLPTLLGLILRKGYVEHPHIMFGAIGDANSDRAPLQVGQWESDNRMDDDLTKLFLEGNGGGSSEESYELAMYFMARHTQTDAWDKRGKKGYIFIIGDEQPYRHVNPRNVTKVIGDDIGEPIPVETMMAELLTRFDVYYIMPSGASHSGQEKILQPWRDLIGQRVIELPNLDELCETIALTVGLAEGTVDLDVGLGHLREEGATTKTVENVGKALATVGAVTSGDIVTADLPDIGGDEGSTRI